MTYLICNAHLDPVWLWRWDEGLTETLSTFRTAAELIDEYDGLIFNHNEALLYEWIEQHEPSLFERIQKLVSEGRWEIIGGWFLQPDCNIPAGESIVRQALTGRKYFKEKFGKVPSVAINFDSFGHARGLVQFLKQAGYDQYIVCRPHGVHYSFPNEDFVWEGYDGSQIIVHRSDENYNSVKGMIYKEIPEWLEKHPQGADTLFLWGVGDHGGGPSRKDLSDIRDMINRGLPIEHAKPSQYFEKLDISSAPVVSEGLNPVAEGCYTSQIRIKQKHRLLENDLVMVEKMASQAKLNGLSTYEAERIQSAWRDLLFSEFHDALPGSAIIAVEEDTLRQLDHGLQITAELKAKYLIALSAHESRVKEGTVPIVVYNPHPFTVKTPVDCELVLPKQGWTNEYTCPVAYQGENRLLSQPAKEQANFNMDWRKRVVFQAELPPCSVSRFDIHFETMQSRPTPSLTSEGGTITIETPRSRVVINEHTGLVDSYIVDGFEHLKPGALSLSVFDDTFNAWGGKPFIDSYNAPIGQFTPMSPEAATAFSGIKGDITGPVRVVEQGDARVVVEAYMQYGESKACQRYMVDMLDGSLAIQTKVFFGEREKRLKLCVPTALDGAEYIGQTMFGREKLDVRAGEYVSQQWSAVANTEHALTIINDSTYGSDYQAGEARLTMLRSAGYSASTFVCGEPFHDQLYQPRMDIGERDYRFVLMGGSTDERLKRIDREAIVVNQMPYALAYCPPQLGEAPKPLIEIDSEQVALSCFKRAECNEEAFVIRVYEAQGLAASFRMSIPATRIECADALKPFEIKTYLLKGGELAPINPMEGMMN